jgi:WD40 repeat protein
VPLRVPPYQVEAAILKLHTRRCCCLEFPPDSDSVVISGDKKGHIAVWNFDQVGQPGVRALTCRCVVAVVGPGAKSGAWYVRGMRSA